MTEDEKTVRGQLRDRLLEMVSEGSVYLAEQAKPWYWADSMKKWYRLEADRQEVLQELFDLNLVDVEVDYHINRVLIGVGELYRVVRVGNDPLGDGSPEDPKLI